MKMKCVFLSCVVALVLTVRAAAQTDPSTKLSGDGNTREDKANSDQQAAIKAREQKALKLLDQVIAESSTLKLPENRIHVLGIASGLIWSRDEKRGRELLKSATESFAAIIPSLDISDQDAFNQVQRLFQVKSELFRNALGYDPASALDFLNKTPIPGMAEQEAQLEAEGALQLADSDPRLALQIAERALAKGITGNLPGIVSQLQSKDPTAAKQLATDIVNKIQSEDLAANTQAFWLAFGMIQMDVQSAGAHAAGDNPRVATSMLLSSDDLKSLLNKIVSISINLGKAGFTNTTALYSGLNALNQLQSLVPQIEKFDPQLSAKVGSQISQVLQASRDSSDPATALQNLAQNGTPDDLIKAAANAPDGMKDQILQQAAWKALNQGDFDKAAQIARDKLENPLTRQQVLNQIDQNSVWKAQNEGKVEEARMLIGRIRNREQRAEALIRLAASVAEKDKKTAAALLGEARASLPDTPENYSHVALLLEIAGAYSQIDASRGIQIMNEIAALLDKLIPAAETLQGFDVPLTFRDGEILMQPNSQISSTVAQFAEQVGTLATSDYAAAVGAAGTAGRSELRILTNLSIASKILGQTGQNIQSLPISGRGFRRSSIVFGDSVSRTIVLDLND
jgi:hypothetical protein